jgi:hypothetical protein
LGDQPIWLPTWDLVFNGCDYGWGTGSLCGLWRVPSRGGAPSRITDHPQDVPTDGTVSDLLFLRPDGDNWDVYRVGIGGGAPLRLTDHAARDGPAAFSPDGQAIAFLSDRSGVWAWYTMDRQGHSVQKRFDLPQGGNYDAGPYPWTEERISWGAMPAGPTPAPTEAEWWLLPAPVITFPIADDEVSSTRGTVVQWSWRDTLGANQGYELRFWHETSSTPVGVAPPTQDTQLEVHFGATDAYRKHGEGFYYLDVVVVQLDPYQVLSKNAPVRVKTNPSK